MDLDQPMEEKPETLSPEQRQRAAAVILARQYLMGQGLAGRTPPDVDALIRLADWLVSGEVEDLYPYLHADGTVQMGPEVLLRADGYVEVKGTLYEPAGDDGD